jgi:hypothetical protein
VRKYKLNPIHEFEQLVSLIEDRYLRARFYDWTHRCIKTFQQTSWVEKHALEDRGLLEHLEQASMQKLISSIIEKATIHEELESPHCKEYRQTIYILHGDDDEKA